MRKTLNQVVRGLVEHHPENWMEMLSFAERLLRASPMEVLGGRSPYEVVTGLKPRLPMAHLGDLKVTEVGIADYTKALTEHLTETYAAVQ